MPAVIGVIMGSTSDWDTMKKACDVLDELDEHEIMLQNI